MTASVRHGDVIRLDRARRLVLILDGKTRTIWVTGATVDDALADLRLREARLKLSSSRSTRLPMSGARLAINTEKQVTLVADGQRTTFTTFTGTVGQALAERDVVLDADDRSSPAPDAVLAEGDVLTVQRVTVKTTTETVTVRAPLQRKGDPDLMLDQKKVSSPGQDGEERRTIRTLYADGKLIERTVVSRTVIVAAKPQVVITGTKPYPPDDTGLHWAALARCESGGNPRSVSSGGTYYGLYQFNVEMWQRMGGIGLPSEATPREQTYRAIKLYHAAGAGQWPVCGPNLFS